MSLLYGKILFGNHGYHRRLPHWRRGAGLSVSGLQMQTVFRNPLAGPSVLGISSGASMGVAFVVLLSGSLGGVALSKLGFMGEIALTIAAIAGSLSIMALYCFRFPKSKGQCYFADYRCDDWLHSQCGDRCAEIFQCGGGYSCICHLGVGKFCPCIGRSDDFIYMYHGGIVATFLPACQNIESFAAGRCIRTESRIEYKNVPVCLSLLVREYW